MQHDETLASGGEVEDGLTVGGRVEEHPVHADHRDVGFGERRGGLVAILSVVHAETSGLERRGVSRVEELRKLVRAAAADEEHAGLAGFPDNGSGGRERGVVAAAFLRAGRRDGGGFLLFRGRRRGGGLGYGRVAG